MAFTPGDAIHVKAIGKGVVREVRNGGRYLVEVKGRSIVTTEDQLTPSASSALKASASARSTRRDHVYAPPSEAAQSLDLHGLTVDESMEAVVAFLNRALLSGAAEVHIIHGRSGGKLKASVHAQLKRMPSIRGYALDPRNAGVTIVEL